MRLSKENSSVARAMFGLLGAFIVPNTIFGFSAFLLGVDRPLVNLDYALSVLLLAFGWRWIGGGVLAFALVVDVLSLLVQVMPFPRLGDVFYLMQFSAFASYQHMGLMAGVGGLVVLVGVCVFWGGGRTSPLLSLLVFNVLAVSSVLAPDSPSADKSRFYRVAQYSWVESQSVILARARSGFFLSMFSKEGSPLVTWSGESASEPLWRKAAQVAGDGRMLLVVVESWGVTRDERVQEALLAPIIRLKLDGLEVRRIKQAGMTLAGELRELCHLYPEHYNLAGVVEGFEQCLPNQLRTQGFETASMHGATSLMYDRNRWYPRAGFQRHTFFEDHIWPSRCYSFPGACDLDLLSSVKDYFSQPGRRFFYWLTLNTHGPNDLRDLRQDLFDCGKYDIDVETESCRNFKLHAQFFDGLARLLSSAEMKGVEFVVVGDHPPTLLDIDEKNKNFYTGVVPSISGVVK